jgi:extracellular factor (EF) 3-hydroxypalmitic acid methyl ester biosynthesis protein
MATASDNTAAKRTRRTVSAPTNGDGFSSDRLDRVYDCLREGPAHWQVHEALDELFNGLHTKKHAGCEIQWRDYIEQCRQHPIKELLHQDPFTFRAYAKPRGYAGDAELLDYIYGCEERWPVPQATPLGQQIFDYTTLAAASEGVRSRRGFVATYIDRMVEKISRPRILSIASGHLREASLAASVKRKKFGRFTALDSDAISLQQVHRDYAWYGIDTVAASIRELITGRLSLGRYDFVYSTGLFDYLGRTTGRRLVNVMFGMLRPGGRLLVANFLPGIRDDGYMEAFMDWHLVYRSRQEMIDLTMELPQAELGRITMFTEEKQNIIFTIIHRRK